MAASDAACLSVEGGDGVRIRKQPYERVVRGCDHSRVGRGTLRCSDDAEVRPVAARNGVDRFEYCQLHNCHGACRWKGRGGRAYRLKWWRWKRQRGIDRLDGDRIPLQDHCIVPTVRRGRGGHGADCFVVPKGYERHEQCRSQIHPNLEAKAFHFLLRLAISSREVA